jgi:hypothetical protein
MTEAYIPGGYILLSRNLIESEIWNKPPLYLIISICRLGIFMRTLIRFRW